MMVNGAASMEDNAETMIVKEGDKLLAAVYKDTVGYNDMYAYFEEGDVSATYGEEVNLTLKGYGPFDSVENAKQCVEYFMANDSIPNTILERVANKYPNFISNVLSSPVHRVKSIDSTFKS